MAGRTGWTDRVDAVVVGIIRQSTYKLALSKLRSGRVTSRSPERTWSLVSGRGRLQEVANQNERGDRLGGLRARLDGVSNGEDELEWSYSGLCGWLRRTRDESNGQPCLMRRQMRTPLPRDERVSVYGETIMLTDFARKSRPALLGRDQQRRADQGCRTLLSALLNPARSDARSRVRTTVVPDNGEPKSRHELLHLIVRRVGLGRKGKNAPGAEQSLFVHDKLDRPAPCSERRDSGLIRTSRVSHGIG